MKIDVVDLYDNHLQDLPSELDKESSSAVLPESSIAESGRATPETLLKLQWKPPHHMPLTENENEQGSASLSLTCTMFCKPKR